MHRLLGEGLTFCLQAMSPEHSCSKCLSWITIIRIWKCHVLIFRIRYSILLLCQFFKATLCLDQGDPIQTFQDYQIQILPLCYDVYDTPELVEDPDQPPAFSQNEDLTGCFDWLICDDCVIIIVQHPPHCLPTPHWFACFSLLPPAVLSFLSCVHFLSSVALPSCAPQIGRASCRERV